MISYSIFRDVQLNDMTQAGAAGFFYLINGNMSLILQRDMLIIAH